MIQVRRRSRRFVPLPRALLSLLLAGMLAGAAGAQDQNQGQEPAGTPAQPAAPEPDPALERASELRAEIELGNGWTRATPANADNAAVYLTIENGNDREMRLIGVTAAIAERAEIHETMTEGGVTRMNALPSLAIPPGGEAVFEPGGLHIMLTGLKAPLREDESFLLTFRFEGIAAKSTVVRVLAADATGPSTTLGGNPRDVISGVTESEADQPE